MAVLLRVDLRYRLPVRFRARAYPGAGEGDSPDRRDAREPAGVPPELVQGGRREARGWPARGPGLHRLRARERDDLPHLHGDGAGPVRRPVRLLPARAHTEGRAGGAEHPAQGRVRGGGAVTETALRRSGPGELRLGVVLVAAAAGAWALTAGRMGGMDAGPGADLGGLGWFAVSLVVMMAAMMLPALAPMLVAYERRASRADSVATFAAGYFAAWLAAGLLAYAVIEGVRSLGPGFLTWNEAGRYV